MTLRRGPIGFALDKKHDFDLAFWRHYGRVAEMVRQFKPDILHITGPSDVGQLGALIAHRLRIPLAASWHTNLHQYAEQRASGLFALLPERLRGSIGRAIRESSLAAILRFYKIPRMLFAPNAELMNLLEKGTGKPIYKMQRGVDTVLFSPHRRDRKSEEFVIGYVGRLTVEKNIRFLCELERALCEARLPDFRFSIVGQGAEEPWLRANMQRADLAGVLKGEALARAYANMDVFVFPSRTDTFGNVVLEALASGVPAIVTDGGGPQFVVKQNETGFIARNLVEFVSFVQRLAGNRQELRTMRKASRTCALNASWERVFEGMYEDYERVLRNCAVTHNNTRVRPQSTVAATRLS